MKHHLLSALLLLGASSAKAQAWAGGLPVDSATQKSTDQRAEPVPGAAKAELYSRARAWSEERLPRSIPAARTDSLQAIHQLFRHERRWARVGTVGLAVSVGAQGVVLATGSFTVLHRNLYLLSGAVNAGFGLVALRDWHRFSKRQEQQAIQRFSLHQAQPAYVQQQLSVYLLSRRKY